MSRTGVVSRTCSRLLRRTCLDTPKRIGRNLLVYIDRGGRGRKTDRASEWRRARVSSFESVRVTECVCICRHLSLSLCMFVKKFARTRGLRAEGESTLSVCVCPSDIYRCVRTLAL